MLELTAQAVSAKDVVLAKEFFCCRGNPTRDHLDRQIINWIRLLMAPVDGRAFLELLSFDSEDFANTVMKAVQNAISMPFTAMDMAHNKTLYKCNAVSNEWYLKRIQRSIVEGERGEVGR